MIKYIETATPKELETILNLPEVKPVAIISETKAFLKYADVQVPFSKSTAVEIKPNGEKTEYVDGVKKEKLYENIR